MSLDQLRVERLRINRQTGVDWPDAEPSSGSEAAASGIAGRLRVGSWSTGTRARPRRVDSTSAGSDGWRLVRLGGLVTADALLALVAVMVAAGNVTDVGIAVALIAPLALAAVGAYRTSWSCDMAIGAMLARLLFAAILSMWLGPMLVGLFDAKHALSEPLLISMALPLAWLLSRFVSRSAVRQSAPRVVFVGTHKMLEKLLFASNVPSEREILGYFVSGVARAPLDPGKECLGGPTALPGFLRTHTIDRVVIAGLERDALDQAIRACDAAGVQIELHVPGLDGASDKTHLSFVNGVPVLRVRESAAPQWSYAVKRAMDVVGASLALIVCAPILAVVSIIALMTHGRPLLFRQWRVGLRGQSFEIVKFRTMSVDAEERTSEFAAGVEAGHYAIGDAVSDLKHAGRGHVTGLGVSLRATSLDEIPQFWNVLRGDMSLVGPRPLRRFEHSTLDPAIAENRSRMRPGITGLWQVSGRSDLSWDERVNLDDVQVRNWTLRDDVEILIETVPAMFNGR